MNHYPIGRAGFPWNSQERLAWLNLQTVKRSYQSEVVSRLEELDGFSLILYQTLVYGENEYPQYAYVSKNLDDKKPTCLITGGVHGYETSGVQGALLFMRTRAADYLAHCNLIVIPCVSPWGYETINRWNPDAIDPNRSFYKNSPALESAGVMKFIDSLPVNVTMHIDLHETTDTDNSEFRPALAARDAKHQSVWNIPDGFYLVADSNNKQLAFQQTIIQAVKNVTHIAPADSDNKIIGVDIESEGVICYDKQALFLCGGFTQAPYCTTTEVYPDSKHATDAICNEAQVAAITAAINFVVNA